MEILVIYKEDYPWDVRVEKLALTLKDSGHNITIVARNRDQLATKDNENGINIRRLPKTDKLPKLLQLVVNLPVWFNPFWLWILLRESRHIKGKSGILIVRDLPLVRAGLLIGSLRKAKVVFDMAECYPEMYASSAQFSNKKSLKKLAKSPWLASRYERDVVKKVDHILVMIEESRDRLLSMGVNKEKITIVSNTPSKSKFSGKTHEHHGDQLRIVYVGFLSKLRGLDVLIEAAAHYINNIGSPEDIRIDIIGKGAQKEKLLKLSKELGITESVKIHGWLDHDEVETLMSKANIGALTYRVCGHWNHTIPNKIFDYMLAGLPVLATEVIPIQRIVEETNCGVICKDNDPKDIAEKLKTLQDPSTRRFLGNNGYSAVESKYNWENDAAALVESVEKLKENHFPKK